MHVSRRQFLQATTSVLATAGVGYGTLRTPPPPRLTIVATRPRAFTYFSRDFRRPSQIEVPTTFQISNAGNLSDLNCELIYDPRVLALGAEALSTEGKSVRSLSIAQAERGARLHRARLTIPAAEEPQSSLELTLPLHTLKLYPRENLGEVAPFSLIVQSVAATARYDAHPIVSGTRVEAWAAEISARWAEITEPVNGSTTYFYPSAVLCRSVGPFAIPAGARMVVKAESRLVATLDVGQVTFPTAVEEARTRKPDERTALRTYSVARSKDSGYSIASVIFDQAIPAGETIEVTLDNVLADNVFVSDPLSALVSISHEIAPPQSQRDTGQVSVTKRLNAA